MRAKEIYTAAGGKAVDVSVNFTSRKSGGDKVSANSKEATALRIAAFVRQQLSSNDKWISFSSDDFDLSDFPEGVLRIRIITEMLGATGFWSLSGSAWLPTLGIQMVGETINAKNSKVAQYRNKATRVGLLIVIDALSLSLTFQVAPETIEAVYASDFDDIFLLSYRTRSYWKLRLQ